jgi:hypothetical protein
MVTIPNVCVCVCVCVCVWSDVKRFVMVTIPKTQRSPVQCYIQRVRSGVQRLWPYYALWLCPDDTMPVSRVCGLCVWREREGGSV